MLYDKIVPNQHPDSAIGAYLGRNGGDPLIGTCKEISAITFSVASTIPFHFSNVKQMADRLIHKGELIPVAGGIIARRIKMMTRDRCKSAKDIHLPHISGYGVHGIMTVDFPVAFRGIPSTPSKSTLRIPTKTLWVLLAVDAKRLLSSVNPNPYVLLLVLETTSKSERSGLKR